MQKFLCLHLLLIQQYMKLCMVQYCYTLSFISIAGAVVLVLVCRRLFACLGLAALARRQSFSLFFQSGVLFLMTLTKTSHENFTGLVMVPSDTFSMRGGQTFANLHCSVLLWFFSFHHFRLTDPLQRGQEARY
jgi:hypothetical protein